ncbi:MAG: hypothetical protein L3J97_07290, partial [Thermoplasmata archaeon]|nr:hypothetical protein [Thermoplasmata archaeon]
SMNVPGLVLALLVQPEYGLPLLLLGCSVVLWWNWEARMLPPALAPYTLRWPWMIDNVRLLHEALSTDKLRPTIQVTYNWLAQQFRRQYGVPISNLFRLREYILRSRIPSRPEFRRAVRLLSKAFYHARYGEDSTSTGWLARWRRPRALARARGAFTRVLDELEALQLQLGAVPGGETA